MYLLAKALLTKYLIAEEFIALIFSRTTDDKTN